jgi:hypothetical protein
MAIANNPFDLNTTKGSDLLNAATSAIAAPQSTGYNAATAGASGYTAKDATPFGYNASTMTGQGYTGGSRTASGYDAATALGTNWNVNNDQTVQGQLTGILAANSPLLQQARAASLAQMNQRGLTNSSMAVGAGQEAVIKQALPIASQDATTYANSGQFNANAANQLAQFNAGQSNQALGFTANANNQAGSENLASENQARSFTATAANQAAAQNQNAANTGMQFNAGAANQASQANANAANQASQFTAGATNQAAATNAAAQNAAAQFTAANQTDVSKQYATALNSTVQNMMDQSMKYALANADSQTKIELQNIDASTRQALAATEATYKNQMQASASANEVFQQVSKNIADIMANPDLSADAKDAVDGVTPKQAAVNIQKSYLQNSLAILSATSGITGLKELLSFT